MTDDKLKMKKCKLVEKWKGEKVEKSISGKD